MITYLIMFAVGVVVEGTVLYLGLRKPLAQTALYTLLINGITHPIAWWLVRFGGANLLLVEVAVVTVETILISLAFRILLRRALLWSCTANAVSAVAGLLLAPLIQRMFWPPPITYLHPRL